MSEENEKVVAICVKDSKIFGLSESGYLTVFDEEHGGWVVRGKNEIFSIAQSNSLKKTDVVNNVPRGRHRIPAEPKIIKDESKGATMIGYVSVGLGLLALWVLLHFFVK